MKSLRFAMLGAGFWAQYQLAAWGELRGVECVALYNRSVEKAKKLAKRFGIPAVYDDPRALLQQEELDFVDIVTGLETHAKFVELAATHRVPVICQKPMASSLAEAVRMAAACKKAGVPLFIHENWRWQQPIRALKGLLKTVGELFRARIDMNSGFPVFKNQPFLKNERQFIISDLGSHLLDTARFLFGEASSLYCQTKKVHRDIKGEDVATIMAKMGEQNATIVINMAYAGNYLEKDFFPQTFAFVEGSKGSIELGPNYWIRTTTRRGTVARQHPPSHYPWADKAYDVVQSSMVPCQDNIISALRGEGRAETTGNDNLKTMQLVYAAYESARRNSLVKINSSQF